MDQERLLYDEKEVLSLWEKVQSEPAFLQPKNSDFAEKSSQTNGTETQGIFVHRGFFCFFLNIYCILWCAARDRILSNLQNHPAPRPAPELQKQKAPVAEIPSACLTDAKATADLIQIDLNILQEQARYISI